MYELEIIILDKDALAYWYNLRNSLHLDNTIQNINHFLNGQSDCLFKVTNIEEDSFYYIDGNNNYISEKLYKKHWNICKLKELITG